MKEQTIKDAFNHMVELAAETKLNIIDEITEKLNSLHPQKKEKLLSMCQEYISQRVTMIDNDLNNDEFEAPPSPPMQSEEVQPVSYKNLQAIFNIAGVIVTNKENTPGSPYELALALWEEYVTLRNKNDHVSMLFSLGIAKSKVNRIQKDQ